MQIYHLVISDDASGIIYDIGKLKVETHELRLAETTNIDPFLPEL